MPFLQITVMTCLAIVLFCWAIATSQRTHLYSLRNVFLAAWLYYGFSVGIDIITGAPIPWVPGEVHMSDPSSWHSVAFVMWCFVLCGVAFISTYTLLQGGRMPKPIQLRYQLQSPPEWVLVLLHILAAWIYSEWFLGMDRMARIAMVQLQVTYKFAVLVVPLALAMDILIVLSSGHRKALTAVVLAIVLSLLTGNRTYVMLMLFVAAFRWQPSITGWKLVAGVVGAIVMLFSFKTLYGVGLAWLQGERVDSRMLVEQLRFTLSGMDAHASYAIAIFYTDHASPMWWGSSYIQKPLLLAWPRFLGGIDVSTLAEEYIWKYHTRTAERGGGLAFSAMAEAWLNFGHMGPVLLGACAGAMTNFFDRRPRGVLYFTVLFMVARLFRSDAASLFKNWVLVWGTMFVVAMTALTVYTVFVEYDRSRLLAASSRSLRRA